MRAANAKQAKDIAEKAEEAAALMRALGHVGRLRVLCDLSDGEKSAGSLVETSGLSQSALSQHLARLRADGFVTTRRDAQTIYYRIADPKVLKVVRLLFELFCNC